MIRALIYALIAGLAVFNGLFSPKSFVIFALQGIWYPSFLPAPLTFMFALSGVIMTLLHLLLTGIPVGLFERIWPQHRKATTAASLWLATMFVPTAYTLNHMLAG
jgi:hypothetical protein